ncbi:MAG: peptidylprolyl isomerase [Lentisphaeria bacterium]
MFISQFNRFIDRHGKIAIIGIALIMIIPFLFMWGPGSQLFRDGGRGKTDLGMINGEKVGIDEFIQQVLALDLQYMRYMRQSNRWPHQAEYFQDQIISQAVSRLLMLQEARRRNLVAVSDDEVMDRLSDMFSKDGKFQGNMYDAIVAQARRKLGATEDDLILAMRDKIIIGRLREQVNSGVFVSDLEAEQEAGRMYELFDVAVARFNADEYTDEVVLKPSAKDIRDYFEENKQDITLPDKKRVRVAVIPFADENGEIQITDEEIEAMMDGVDPDASKAELQAVREKIRRKLRAEKQRSVALRKARDLIGQIIKAFEEQGDQKGAADTIKKLADELGIKTVDSGPFTKWTPIPNVGRNQELQEKAYALSAENPIAPLVRTEKRIYMAVWLETIPGKPASELTEILRRKLEEKLLTSRLREYYQDKVEPFRAYSLAGKTPEQLLQGIRNNSLGSLPKGPLNEVGPRVAPRMIQEYYAPYFIPPEKQVVLAQFSFSEFRGEVEAVTEDDIKEYYANNKKNYKIEAEEADEPENGEIAESEPSYKPLSEVGNDIREQLVRQRTNALAAEAADEFSYNAYIETDNLESPEEAASLFIKLAEKAGIDTRLSPWFNQNARVPAFNYDPEIASEAFEVSPDKAISTAIKTDNSYLVVCWKGSRPGRLPTFDSDPAIAERVKQDVIQEEAVQMARQKAEAAYVTLSDTLAKDQVVLEDLADNWDFEELDEFTRREPPQAEDGSNILSAASELPANSLSKPVKIETGALLVFVQNREKPVGEELMKKVKEVKTQLQWRKQNAAMQDLVETLQAQEKTSVNKDLAEQILSY